MTKDKNTKPETIEDQKQVWEKIETIYPEEIETPSYDYWQSQQTIDWDPWIRNIWKFHIWKITITWTGNIDITGVWFRPKMVQFQVCNWTDSWIWQMTRESQNCINLKSWSISVTECINYGNPVWLKTKYTSMNKDWFSINCTYYGTDTQVAYICYK
jgi:hypothetical protein